MKGKLIIVRGLPGSGKSTVASRLAQECGFVHLETDKLFMINGEYVFDANKLTEYHEATQKACDELRALGFDVIVSNTFVNEWEIEKYENPDVIIRCCDYYEGIHNVPEEIIQKMSENMVDIKDEICLSSYTLRGLPYEDVKDETLQRLA